MQKSTGKSEIALAAGIALAVIPLAMDYIPKDSAWVPVLGALLAIATYIGGRQLRLGAEAKANAVIEAAKAAPSANPSKPSTSG
jgi:hypothetical protein